MENLNGEDAKYSKKYIYYIFNIKYNLKFIIGFRIYRKIRKIQNRMVNGQN